MLHEPTLPLIEPEAPQVPTLPLFEKDWAGHDLLENSSNNNSSKNFYQQQQQQLRESKLRVEAAEESKLRVEAAAA